MSPKGRHNQQTAGMKKQMFPKQTMFSPYMLLFSSITDTNKPCLYLALTLKNLKAYELIPHLNLSLRVYSNKMGHISLPVTAAAPPTEAAFFFYFSKPITLLHLLQVYSFLFFVC